MTAMCDKCALPKAPTTSTVDGTKYCRAGVGADKYGDHEELCGKRAEKLRYTKAIQLIQEAANIYESPILREALRLLGVIP